MLPATLSKHQESGTQNGHQILHQILEISLFELYLTSVFKKLHNRPHQLFGEQVLLASTSCPVNYTVSGPTGLAEPNTLSAPVKPMKPVKCMKQAKPGDKGCKQCYLVSCL